MSDGKIQIISDNLGQAIKEGACGVYCGAKAFKVIVTPGNKILMHLRIEDLQAITGLPVIEIEEFRPDEIAVLRPDGSVWKRWVNIR